MIRRKLFRLKLSSRTLGSWRTHAGDGRVERNARQLFRRREIPATRERDRACLCDGACRRRLLDIGGESTRPGSVETSASEELDRILPVLEALRGRLKIPISVDTRRASVAELAIRAGAELVNDVSGLRSDPRIAEAAARHRVPLILMQYAGRAADDASGGICTGRLERCDSGAAKVCGGPHAGRVGKSQIIVDPGIGFGKSFAQNYELLQKLPATREARLSVAGGNIEEGLHRCDSGSGRQACVTGRANLGHCRHGYREHPERGAHCARPRCGRNSAGGARR